jgi:hypothetical protein
MRLGRMRCGRMNVTADIIVISTSTATRLNPSRRTARSTAIGNAAPAIPRSRVRRKASAQRRQRTTEFSRLPLQAARPVHLHGYSFALWQPANCEDTLRCVQPESRRRSLIEPDRLLIGAGARRATDVLARQRVKRFGNLRVLIARDLRLTPRGNVVRVAGRGRRTACSSVSKCSRGKR